MSHPLEQLSPIIIVGMHRSGTTLVANSLRQCGVFTGENLDQNGEPRLFLGLNEWLLSEVSADWDSSVPVNTFLNRPNLVAEIQNRLTHRTVGLYTGKRFLRRPSLFSLQPPWGWKDPRTTVTLPIWLEIFPLAKIIHVLRNGTDVALSLQKRELRKRELGGHFLAYLSESCFELEGGLELWESYVHSALFHLDTWPDERHITIKYETFLTQPKATLETLLSFCGVDSTPMAIDGAVGKIDASRAFAFRQSEQGVAFHQVARQTPMMRQLGYHRVDKAGLRS